jgi:hypothetical protein
MNIQTFNSFFLHRLLFRVTLFLASCLLFILNACSFLTTVPSPSPPPTRVSQSSTLQEAARIAITAAHQSIPYMSLDGDPEVVRGRKISSTAYDIYIIGELTAITPPGPNGNPQEQPLYAMLIVVDVEKQKWITARGFSNVSEIGLDLEQIPLISY